MGNHVKTDADRLRELLARACLSQRAFAREIDMSERSVRYWCSGEQPVPQVAMLAAEHLATCESTRKAREEREGWTRDRLVDEPRWRR
jgi:transcriptional regulator with XRE-family HTH domain